MANKVGKLIKDARTDAGFTQEQLAKKVSGLSVADLGKAERGEKELPQQVLKDIAKATGVTQVSLLNAAKESTYSAKKTTSSKTATAKKTSSKKTASSKSADDYTATEKKLVELYRNADKDTKQQVMKILKGEDDDSGDLLSGILNGAMELFGKK